MELTNKDILIIINLLEDKINHYTTLSKTSKGIEKQTQENYIKKLEEIKNKIEAKNDNSSRF